MSLVQAKKWLEDGKGLNKIGESKKAIELLQQAGSIFKDAKEWELYVDSLNELGIGKCQLSNHGLAIEIAQQALDCNQTYLQSEKYRLSSDCLIAACYTRKGAYEKAVECYNELIERNIRFYGYTHKDTAAYYNNLGVCLQDKGDYEEAIITHKKSLKIGLELSGEDNEKVATSYGNIGLCYRANGDFKEAMGYQKKALEIRLAILGENHQDTLLSFLNFSLLLKDNGEYEYAIACTEKLINIGLKVLGEEHNLIAAAYHNIGNFFQILGDNKRAINYFEKAIDIWAKINHDNKEHIASCYYNLSLCYCIEGDIEKAFNYVKKAQQLWTKVLGVKHNKIGMCYNLLGEIYSIEGKCEEAYQQHVEALELYQNIWGGQHPEVARSFNNMGNVLLKLKKYEEARICFYKAIKNDIKDEELEQQKYSFFEYQEHFESETSLTAFEGLLQANLKVNDPKNLLYNLFLSQAYVQVVNNNREKYQEDRAKLMLARKAHKSFDLAIGTSFLSARFAKKNPSKFKNLSQEIQNLNQEAYPVESIPYCQTAKDCLESAFYFSEQSKAILLLNQFNEEKAKKAAGIPQDLQDQENKLKEKLNNLEKQIHQEEYKGKEEKDEAKLQELKDERYTYKRAYKAHIQTYRQKYPHYHNAKHDTKIVSIEKLQQKLSEKAAIVSYFVGKNDIYIFVVTKKKYKLKIEEKPRNFDQKIIDFLDMIHLADEATYSIEAYHLYRKLFQPIDKYLKDIDELIIIPDGTLAMLPFEALLTKAIPTNISYPDMPYLLLDYDISYHYSATLWYKGYRRKKQGIKIDKSFLGVAPVCYEAHIFGDINGTVKETNKVGYNVRNTRSVNIRGEKFCELEYSKKEVEIIQELFKAYKLGAKVQLHEKASISNFKHQAPLYQYLLIAAHGDYDPDKPELSGIAFAPPQEHEVDTKKQVVENTLGIELTQQQKDDILYMSDAYELRLNAELVVLSCCNSGIGKQYKGEGMMGINRGFLFAGAKNVVYTLFKVYDDVSWKLTKGLFEHILAGKNYKQALRQAKIDMIKKRVDAAPSAWSGYVLIGD